VVAQFDRRVSITSIETIQKKTPTGSFSSHQDPYATLTTYFGIGLLLSFLEPSHSHSKSSLTPFHFLKIFRAVGLAWLVSQLPRVDGGLLRGSGELSLQPETQNKEGVWPFRPMLRGTGRDLEAADQHRRLSGLGTYEHFDCSSVVSYSFDYHLPCGDVSWLLNDMSVSESDDYLNSVIPSRLTGNSSGPAHLNQNFHTI